MRGSENGNRWSPTGFEALTRSGEMISLLDPRPEQIHMKDIAAHLAAMVRFNGACPLQPTIAQHSLAVSRIAIELLAQSGLDMMEADYCGLARAALMHDAAEYLVGDNIGAVKKMMRVPRDGPSNAPEFDVIEDRVQAAIVARFDCADTGWEDIIHEADCIACAYEMSRDGWCSEAMPPEWAADSDWLEECYDPWPRSRGGGGEAAFIKRAAQLGMTD
jgi:5'-deoxynucleotidase YfbR-like HD superfamily hydrolase